MNNKATHTPGPWEYMPRQSHHCAPGVRGANGFYVDTINDNIDEAISEANARLIAAAPEMYEALRAGESKLREAVSAVTGRGVLVSLQVCESAVLEVADSLRAVIAKADGAAS